MLYWCFPSRRTRLLCLAVVLALGFWGCRPPGSPDAPTGAVPSIVSPTGYYAFFLDNNLLVYAKTDSFAAPFLTLKDVYYIRAEPDPVSKELKQKIYKRGSEFHRPDSMIVRAEHIVLIESVGQESEVMRVIRGTSTNR
jgi:hypothetical protein